MPRVSIRNGDQYYFASVTRAWAIAHDNGALVSCGLTVGQDGFTPRMFAWLQSRDRLDPITKDEWNHSGCQSYCVKRGAKECRW